MREFRTDARELSAKLIPHTTSVHNVVLIQAELEKAYAEGAASMIKTIALLEEQHA